MAGKELHLTERETLRIIGRTPEEVEVEATWDPGARPPPAHLHPSQDEEFVAQSGRMTAWICSCSPSGPSPPGPRSSLRCAPWV
jgi:hypothetical protein